MMKRLALLMMVSLATAPLAAQTPMVMGDLGVGVPLDPFSADSVSPGLSYGITIATPLTPYLSAYAGFGGARFPVELSPPDSTVDAGPADRDRAFANSGLMVGLRLFVPWADEGARVRPWVQGGAVLFPRLSGGYLFALADEATGYELAAGANIRVTPTLSVVVPNIRYRTFPYELEGILQTAESDMRYLTVGVGVAYLVRI